MEQDDPKPRTDGTIKGMKINGPLHHVSGPFISSLFFFDDLVFQGVFSDLSGCLFVR